MDLSIHFLVSLLLAIVFYPIVGWLSAFIILGGFFIDADHYVWTLLAKKRFSIRYSYDYYKKRQHTKDYILHPLHTIEFIFLVIFLSLSHLFAALFALGYFIHLILDRVYSIQFTSQNQLPFRWFWLNDQQGQRSFSIIYWLFVEFKLVPLYRGSQTNAHTKQIFKVSSYQS